MLAVIRSHFCFPNDQEDNCSLLSAYYITDIKRSNQKGGNRNGHKLVFFLPVGLQRHVDYFKCDEIWHENCLRNYTSNGDVDTLGIVSLTS